MVYIFMCRNNYRYRLFCIEQNYRKAALNFSKET